MDEHWSEAKEAIERGLVGFSGREDAAGLPDLAEAYLGEGEYEKARTTIDKALSALGDSGLRLECTGLLTLARVLLRTEGIDARDRIEQTLAKVWRICEETGQRLWLPHIHFERAELARLGGDEETREHELHEAHRLFVEIGATGHVERLAKELGL